jgi:vacuolar-type H+-ATPase subunit F/Vma7
MSVAEFIGDEVSAAGYRLCGVDVIIADEGNVLSMIRKSCERASLVLVGSSLAQQLQRADLDALLANIQPPVLVVPDVSDRHEVPDIASRVNKQLGLLE